MGNCAGVILAGGKSSRMGEDKSNLRLNGKTLLQHMSDLLYDAGLKEIYVSHPDIIPDEIAGRGPLSGIHAILKNIPKSYKHVIFLPVDMPRLTPLLISELVTAPDNYPLVSFDKYKMPLRLSTNKQWINIIEDMLNKNDNVSLGAFQNSINSQLLIGTMPTQQSCFDNINSPDQWDALLKG